MFYTNGLREIEENFNGAISPYADEIQKSTINWGKEFGFLYGENLPKYDKQSIAYLASRAQPYDSFRDVRLTSDYLLLFCILDDYSDKSKDENEFEKYSNKIISIFNGDINYIEDPFLSGWEDWWERIKVGTTIEWQDQIIKSIKSCLKSIIWEIKNQKNGCVPEVESYIEKRQNSGSVFVCFDLIERGGGMFIPSKTSMSLLKELITSANKIANWTNDILSLDKEIKDGEVHNLVIIIQNQNDNTIEEALKQTKKIMELEIDNFYRIKDKLFKFNKPFDSNIIKFISRLEIAIRGHYEWSVRTKRFSYSNK